QDPGAEFGDKVLVRLHLRADRGGGPADHPHVMPEMHQRDAQQPAGQSDPHGHPGAAQPYAREEGREDDAHRDALQQRGDDDQSRDRADLPEPDQPGADDGRYHAEDRGLDRLDEAEVASRRIGLSDGDHRITPARTQDASDSTGPPPGPPPRMPINYIVW